MEIKPLGVGSAFSGFSGEPKGNTCFILSAAGKKYLIDVPKDLFAYFRAAGEDVRQIDGVFLTHIHEDHFGDLGSLLFEKYFVEKKKLDIYTSKAIYRCAAKKLEDSLCPIFNPKNPAEKNMLRLEDYVNHIEINPNKPLADNGLRVESRFNWHPVETLGLKFSHEGRSLAYSSDTKYGVKFLESLCDNGKITKSRRDALLGFLWDADIVLHEATLAPVSDIHTNFSELLALPDDVRRKLYVVHSDSIVAKDTFGNGIRVMERYKKYEVGH